MSTVTEAERKRLLDNAVQAMQAYHAVQDPNTNPFDQRVAREREHLAHQAAEAVTKAVTRGEHVHSLIALQVGCSGLQVIRMILDEDAAVEALQRERLNAKNYMASVMDMTRRRTLAIWGRERENWTPRGGDRGAKTALAERIGVTRRTLDAWIADAEAGREPVLWRDEQPGNE